MLTQGFPLVTLAWATRKVRGCLKKKKKKSILSIYFIVIFIFVSQICSFLNVFEAFVTQWDRQCCSPAKQARNTDFFNYTIKYTKPLLSPNWPSKKRKRKKRKKFQTKPRNKESGKSNLHRAHCETLSQSPFLSLSRETSKEADSDHCLKVWNHHVPFSHPHPPFVKNNFETRVVSTSQQNIPAACASTVPQYFCHQQHLPIPLSIL